jgi:hypothetical protein
MIFEKIFVLSLATRNDRWTVCQKHLLDLGITTAIRFVEDPILSTNYIARHRAAALSHLKICEYAKIDRLRNYLVLEDDVLFLLNPNDFKGYEYLATQPWDMFYFGANICNNITRVNDNIGRLSHAQALHAYAVNSNFYDELLKLKPRIQNENTELDVIIANEIVPNNRCFISIPIHAIQRPSYSDIEKRDVNYNWMIERYNSSLRGD